MPKTEELSPEQGKQRLDKWLWAARFFKTRALAVEAIESGKIAVNDVRAKPSKAIGSGDMLSIRLGPYQHVVEVLGLSAKRGPAPQAQLLYRETEESIRMRAELSAEIKASRITNTLKGRPTKRDRRDLDKLKRGVW